MNHNENPSVPTPNGEGLVACPECAATLAELDKQDIEFEVVTPCNWCRTQPADSDPEMEGCCSLDCRYMLAKDEGFVTDAEHDQYISEGWVPEGAA